MKKRFWKGSLTWICHDGLSRFKQIAIRARLWHEFSVLNHVDSRPELFVKEGEWECAIQGIRELEKIGWSSWEAGDISSFHHNWYFNKRWKKKTTQQRRKHSQTLLRNLKLALSGKEQ